MRHTSIVGLSLWLAHSAAATETAVPPGPESATLLETPVIVSAPEPRYVAPTLRDRIGRIWAPVTINGRGPFRLVLDTGANSAAVIPSVIESLGLPTHEAKKVQLHGVTGSAIVPYVSVDSMEVGDLLIEGAKLPVVADVFGGAEGVLGAKGLIDKRIFIDFRNDKIRIERSRGQAGPAGATRVPFRMSNQLMVLDIDIGSVRTAAVFDTGAQQTIGNHTLRDALMRREREGTDATIIGVTLDVAQGRSIRVPPINLSGIQVRNMHVTFGDMFIFEQWRMTKDPAMLIGMDVIGTLDSLVIDYRKRELWMTARR